MMRTACSPITTSYTCRAKRKPVKVCFEAMVVLPKQTSQCEWFRFLLNVCVCDFTVHQSPLPTFPQQSNLACVALEIQPLILSWAVQCIQGLKLTKTVSV